MAPVKSNVGKAKAVRPRVLIVDDEADLLEAISDTVGRQIGCRLVGASTFAEARKVLESQKIDLMVTDVNLPDGDGLSLLSVLHLHQPNAQAIVITGKPTVDGAIEAIREGAADFVKKPFDNKDLVDRVRRALERVRSAIKGEKRLNRLRDAVKRLNDARKMVSKKVDLLCNDLINAYGELSKQLDLVRVQEGYKHAANEAKDLEQLLCHTMDWMLRQLGYCNIAVWLAGEDEQMQLGAYMKYTIAGEAALTDALAKGIVKVALKDNMLHLAGDALNAKLTADERELVSGQDLMAVNCTYLAESLGVMVMFRDATTPFTEEDAATVKAVTPLFATALAAIVRGHEDGDDASDAADPFESGGLLDETNTDQEKGDAKDQEKGKTPPKKKRERKDDADWWKRGEAPPF